MGYEDRECQKVTMCAMHPCMLRLILFMQIRMYSLYSDICTDATRRFNINRYSFSLRLILLSISAVVGITKYSTVPSSAEETCMVTVSWYHFRDHMRDLAVYVN